MERKAFFDAIKQGDRAAVERALAADPAMAAARDESGLSAVLTAQYFDEPAIAEILLSQRPVLDVFEAAAAGEVARVRELVEAEPSLVDAFAPDGFQPLGLAAFFKRPDVVRLLLERGADASTASRNGLAVTPLHSAVADAGAGTPVARMASIEITRALLDAGAPVNARSAQDGTALHTAAFGGHRAIVELLLEKGADPAAKTAAGKTPADVARERGHAEIAQLLETRSARAGDPRPERT